MSANVISMMDSSYANQNTVSQAQVIDPQQAVALGGNPANLGGAAPGASFAWGMALITLVLIRVLYEVAEKKS